MVKPCDTSKPLGEQVYQVLKFSVNIKSKY